MPIIVDVAQASRGREVLAVPGYTRTTREEDNYFITMYMGAPPDSARDTLAYRNDDKTLPQAYLVEQPPGSTIPAHYHDTDQYQVFINGSAVFGKKPIGPLTVHFAGGHTPYGPILTQHEATHFFTFRAHWDGGGKPMPENRPNLQHVRRVYRLAKEIETEPPASDLAEVIPAEPDGLGTSLFYLDANQQSTVDLPVAGGGQYALVLEGAVTHGDQTLAKHSCVYRFPDEQALVLTAGDAGATVLLLQFPQREPLDPLSDRRREAVARQPA
ncbi:MAG: hypothetical protein AB8C46_08945 [Burkholderiaceae bacterium]